MFRAMAKVIDLLVADLKSRVPCPDCKGSGETVHLTGLSDGDLVKCEKCGGSGWSRKKDLK